MQAIRTCTRILDLIKEFEGLRLSSYLDRSDPGGIWTIGWGHTRGVVQGMSITLDQAEELFHQDIRETEEEVSRVVTLSLSDNQFSALVSLVFNIGIGSFSTSHLLKYINEGDFDGAGSEFLKWNHEDGVVVAGLTRRREAEQEVFMHPPQRTLN